ncbi:hypothetical protein [uncultured Clostridium sp.]|uniref:hypothetical protein n=1 Tax=uncultured Clostridium sp. TaxID=59620 RepID=UPI0026EE675A|nr:hypothetical protein [uncultured Clostridium sp.]
MGEDRFQVSGKIEERSQPIQEVVEGIVKKYCKDLDRIMETIKKWLADESDALNDQELEDLMIRIPLFLYDVCSSQELVGLQSSIADQVHKEAYSEAFRIARGTIADKNSVADLNTRSEQLEKIIYERAYKGIKLKIEMAVEMLASIKKVQSARMQQYDMGKFASNRM